jgi:PIN domain nuclease of toxin-antitoxin system
VLTPKDLSAHALRTIESAHAARGLACADMNLWEIGMLIEKGRIKIDMDTEGFP